MGFAIALAFRLEPLVANLPLAAADDVTTVVAVVEPLGEEINGIAKAPGYIDKTTARDAYRGCYETDCSGTFPTLAWH